MRLLEYISTFSLKFFNYFLMTTTMTSKAMKIFFSGTYIISPYTAVARMRVNKLIILTFIQSAVTMNSSAPDEFPSELLLNFTHFYRLRFGEVFFRAAPLHNQLNLPLKTIFTDDLILLPVFYALCD